MLADGEVSGQEGEGDGEGRKTVECGGGEGVEQAGGTHEVEDAEADWVAPEEADNREEHGAGEGEDAPLAVAAGETAAHTGDEDEAAAGYPLEGDGPGGRDESEGGAVVGDEGISEVEDGHEDAAKPPDGVHAGVAAGAGWGGEAGFYVVVEGG